MGDALVRGDEVDIDLCFGRVGRYGKIPVARTVGVCFLLLSIVPVFRFVASCGGAIDRHGEETVRRLATGRDSPPDDGAGAKGELRAARQTTKQMYSIDAAIVGGCGGIVIYRSLAGRSATCYRHRRRAIDDHRLVVRYDHSQGAAIGSARRIGGLKHDVAGARGESGAAGQTRYAYRRSAEGCAVVCKGGISVSDRSRTLPCRGIRGNRIGAGHGGGLRIHDDDPERTSFGQTIPVCGPPDHGCQAFWENAPAGRAAGAFHQGVGRTIVRSGGRIIRDQRAALPGVGALYLIGRADNAGRRGITCGGHLNIGAYRLTAVGIFYLCPVGTRRKVGEGRRRLESAAIIDGILIRCRTARSPGEGNLPRGTQAHAGHCRGVECDRTVDGDDHVVAIPSRIAEGSTQARSQEVAQGCSLRQAIEGARDGVSQVIVDDGERLAAHRHMAAAQHKVNAGDVHLAGCVELAIARVHGIVVDGDVEFVARGKIECATARVHVCTRRSGVGAIDGVYGHVAARSV